VAVDQVVKPAALALQRLDQLVEAGFLDDPGQNRQRVGQFAVLVGDGADQDLRLGLV
jgi:hypothetical protein